MWGGVGVSGWKKGVWVVFFGVGSFFGKDSEGKSEIFLVWGWKNSEGTSDEAPSLFFILS